MIQLMRLILALFFLVNVQTFAQTPELIPYLKGKRWGFVNAQREIVVPCMYDYVYPFSEGLALVELKRKFGYINAQGKTVIPLKYDQAWSFRNGRAKVEMIFGKRTDGQFKIGYIDTTGKTLIPCKYLGVTSFYDGLATIWDGNFNGYMNTEGEVVVAPQYKYASQFREKRAWVASKAPEYDPVVDAQLFKELALIDTQGKKLAQFKKVVVESFSDKWCLVIGKTSDGILTRYFIDDQGKKVLDVSSYEAVHGFTEGLAAVMKNGKLGFIDKSGKLVIPCRYTVSLNGFRKDYKRQFFKFINGVTAVKIAPNKGWNVINKQGKMILKRNYQYLRVITPTQILAKLNNKWGILSLEGKALIPIQYDKAKPFRNGIALVRKGRRLFYVNKEGEEYFEE